MANNENLLKGNPDTQFKAGHKQVAIARKGGKALGEANKQRKNFAQLGLAMVNAAVLPEQIEALQKQFPELTKDQLTNRVLMLQKQMQKAIVDGDSKAFEVIRDTIGEKPEPPTPQETGKTIYNIAATVTDETLRKLINVTPVKKVKKIEELI